MMGGRGEGDGWWEQAECVCVCCPNKPSTRNNKIELGRRKERRFFFFSLVFPPIGLEPLAEVRSREEMVAP